MNASNGRGVRSMRPVRVPYTCPGAAPRSTDFSQVKKRRGPPPPYWNAIPSFRLPRRSSSPAFSRSSCESAHESPPRRDVTASHTPPLHLLYAPGSLAISPFRHDPRSEEHTSELQSHSFISYAVF